MGEVRFDLAALHAVDAATALDISCTHNLPSPNAAHVHEAPFGVNGPVVFTFPSPASPLSGSVPMTPRLIADFAAVFLYVDIHTGTDEETADEIRGQIILTSDRTPKAIPTFRSQTPEPPPGSPRNALYRM